MNIAVDTFKIFAAGVGVGIGISCLTMITIKTKQHENAVREECAEKLAKIAREKAKEMVEKEKISKES